MIQTPPAPPVDATASAANALAEHNADIELGRELLLATRPFAIESIVQSWWHVVSTFALLVAAMAGAGLAPWWPVRALLAGLSSLIMVRTFILYHDYMHGAILRKSRLAQFLFFVYGCCALTPPQSWAQSHNHHHGHVGEITGDGVGAFPLITTRMWREASPAQRARYRAIRHPLILLFGYVTIFFFSITLAPLLRSPSKYRDSALGLLLHGGLITILWLSDGFQTAFFVVLLPMTIASIIGSYLFFAQHSFKQMIVLSKESWSFYRASLKSSSYLRMNRVMQWFTGNIGYHHVHHLNVRIPFYRLPEAMAAIPDLQSPLTTTLSPREIVACFRASLWDEEHQRMVSYGEAAAG